MHGQVFRPEADSSGHNVSSAGGSPPAAAAADVHRAVTVVGVVIVSASRSVVGRSGCEGPVIALASAASPSSPCWCHHHHLISCGNGLRVSWWVVPQVSRCSFATSDIRDEGKDVVAARAAVSEALSRGGGA